MKFKGHKAASGKNVNYIMRDSACEDVSFHNLNELESKSQYENKVNARSYAHNREEEEKGRTHYRVVLSWDRTEETRKAREMTHEFLQENFKDSRAIVAIHQDTEHTHAHVWIDARQENGKKIHSEKNHINELSRSWQNQYDRQYQTSYEKEFAAKREESRQYRENRHNGKESEKPERAEITSEQYREKDQRDAGVRSNGIDQEATRGNQRPFEVRSSNANESEQALNRSKQDFEQSNQAVDESQQRLNQSKYAVDRADNQTNGTIRETQELRESVEKYSRTINEKIVEKDRGMER
jgi:hypothetical protein